jgi:hypothetical protein
MCHWRLAGQWCGEERSNTARSIVLDVLVRGALPFHHQTDASDYDHV